MKLSLIIPAYNEEKRIGTTLEKYISYLDTFCLQDYEIIVVSDGTDSTPEMVSPFPKTRIIKSNKKLGKGGAVQLGFANSSGNIVGFVDADLSTSPDQFQKLLDKIEYRDCVISSRNCPESVVVAPISTRYYLSKLFNIMIRIMFELNVSDTQCGAKLFKQSVIEKVLPDLKLTGFEFDVELLWLIKKQGFQITEVPIRWEHNNGSKFKYSYIPSMFIRLLNRRFFS